MATVELRFSAQPEHVRTARLVAAAVARRAGVDVLDVIDEPRAARAVGLHRNHDVTAPVTVVLIEEEKTFSIEVGDGVFGPESDTAAGEESGDTPGEADRESEAEDEMGLAVISGLVDDVEVRSGPHGGVIRMSWPKTPATVLP